jgi:hypothetical protein
MVHLLLISSKGLYTPLLTAHCLQPLTRSLAGNGVRYFPYSGYLGLSPVKVEGGLFSSESIPVHQLNFDFQWSSLNLIVISRLYRPSPSQFPFGVMNLVSGVWVPFKPTFSSTTPRHYGLNRMDRITTPLETASTPSRYHYLPMSVDSAPCHSSSTVQFGE